MIRINTLVAVVPAGPKVDPKDVLVCYGFEETSKNCEYTVEVWFETTSLRIHISVFRGLLGDKKTIRGRHQVDWRIRPSQVTCDD